MFRLVLTHSERLQFALCKPGTAGHAVLTALLQCDMDALDDGIPILADGPWFARCDVLIYIPHDFVLLGPCIVCPTVTEKLLNLQLEINR